MEHVRVPTSLAWKKLRRISDMGVFAEDHTLIALADIG